MHNNIIIITNITKKKEIISHKFSYVPSLFIIIFSHHHTLSLSQIKQMMKLYLILFFFLVINFYNYSTKPQQKKKNKSITIYINKHRTYTKKYIPGN